MKWLPQARARRVTGVQAKPVRRAAGWLQALIGLLAVGAGIAIAVAALPARAQSQDDGPPPSRVGRVAWLSGTVQAYAEGQDEWVPATLNQPLTSRNSLWADEGAQAEVGIGSAAIQLDGATQADFSQVDDAGVSVNIARGTVALQLRQVTGGEGWTLAAGNAALHAVIPGRYALSYSPNTKLVVAKVFAGAARVSVGGSSVALAAGQQATLDTLAEDLRGQDAVRRSSFDDWALARADARERSAAAQYVSPEMTGADSLERHGSWSNDPGYGAVWFPTVVAAGWAPYRYGRWAWMAPWGWTWIDDSPWGFAPFHYGRWARFGPRWGWVPGHRIERPVYAPALVGFYGSGPGGVSVNVGWFPLAPGEIYRPPYYGRDDYVRRINRDRHGQELPIGELRKREKLPAFRYAHEPLAATVVPAPAFRAREAVGRAVLPWNQREMSGLRPATAQVPAAPAVPVRAPLPDAAGSRMQQPGSERGPLPAPRNDRRWTPAVPAHPAVAPDIRPRVVPERSAPVPVQQEPARGGRTFPRGVPGAHEPPAPSPAAPVAPRQPQAVPAPAPQPVHRTPLPEPRPQPQAERPVEPPPPRVRERVTPRPAVQPPVAAPPQAAPQAQPAQPTRQGVVQRPQNPAQRGAEGPGPREGRARMRGERDDQQR